MHNKKDFIQAAIVSLVAFGGMVCACIYHFHENGFFLGFIGFVISGIWIFVMARDNIRECREEQR